MIDSNKKKKKQTRSFDNKLAKLIYYVVDQNVIMMK